MGLWNFFSRKHSRVPSPRGNVAARRASQPSRRRDIERMEPRQLLAGDIHFGGVYFEEATGDDSAGDRFEITFTGGEPGTRMTRVVIDTDKDGLGLSSGDLFFDIESGGLGAFNAVGLIVGPTDGFTVTAVTVADGGTLLAFDLVGFDAGEKLVFTIDVDEAQFVDELTGQVDVNSLVEGGEFQRSKLTATFAAPHFFEAQGTALFFDAYDEHFGQLDAANGTQLSLPADNYIPPDTTDRTDRTAGAAALLAQQPLPVSIAGTVFHDLNLNNLRDAGESGLADVALELWRLEGAGYVATGLSTITDGAGNYQFDDLAPGTYRIVETQPATFFSIGATAGNVAGSTRGLVETPDVIRDIVLLGGEESVRNDFAEAKEAELHGNVYIDANDNGLLDAGETGIAGATVIIEYLPPDGGPAQSIELLTDDEGRWWAMGLRPGDYRVAEVTPAGMIDGRDTAGSAGGTAHNPGDSITDIFLAGGQIGIDYNFGELLPSSIAGRVHADADGDCEFDPGETTLAGIEIWLLDADENVIETTTTDAEGIYRFDGLAPGTYGVFQVQPSAYFDGDERAGSAGGVISADDTITLITLGPGVQAVDYDFCEHEPVSISGFVYVDLNNNGQFDAGETPLAGVTLTLTDGDGNATGQTTTTDDQGFYRFAGLAPGVYGVREAQPDGLIDGLDTAGSAGGAAVNPGDLITGAILDPGVHGVNYNFGELLPSSITGRVHADNDGNCVFDPGETPLAGVEIRLLDADGNVIDTTTTDDEGVYRFDGLAPGTYGIREIQPSGFLDGDEHVGSAGGRTDGDDRIVDISLGPGTVAVDYDFCEFEPATLSGFVFQDGPVIFVEEGMEDDINVRDFRDGTRTPDDTPLVGVTLRLTDASGQAILDSAGEPITTVTDANGFYQFTGLRPGTYAILQSHPEGLVDGIDTPGTAGGQAFNRESESTANAFEGTHGFDAIVDIQITGGIHSEENNFSEVMVDSIPSLPPPIPPPVPPPVPPPAPPPAPPEPPPTPFPVFPPESDLPPAPTPGAAVAAPTQIPPQPPLAILPASTDSSSRFVTRVRNYTWHLSVIDAGLPRSTEYDAATAARLVRTHYDIGTWHDPRWNVNSSRWLLAGDDPTTAREVVFGITGGVPLAGDFNGDGVAELAIFRDGRWYVDLNGNGVWDDDDLWARLGTRDDLPVVGDWDGDGKADIGIFGPAWNGDPAAVAAEPGLPDPHNDRYLAPKNLPPHLHNAALGWRTMKRTRTGPLRADLIDHVFHYGTAGEYPVAGDFNGDGVDQIGVFRDGKWVLDADGNGAPTDADIRTTFGQVGDLPVTGDFNGDGVDQIGVFRDGLWIIDSNGDFAMDDADEIHELGRSGDQPITGDFDGDGKDELAVYRDDAA